MYSGSFSDFCSPRFHGFLAVMVPRAQFSMWDTHWTLWWPLYFHNIGYGYLVSKSSWPSSGGMPRTYWGCRWSKQSPEGTMVIGIRTTPGTAQQVCPPSDPNVWCRWGMFSLTARNSFPFFLRRVSKTLIFFVPGSWAVKYHTFSSPSIFTTIERQSGLKVDFLRVGLWRFILLRV